VKKSDTVIALGLLLAVFLWGANNAGTKFIVREWPPVFTGSTRFLSAGLIMLAIFRWTNWLGEMKALTPLLNRQLWWRGGLSLAAVHCVLQLGAAADVGVTCGALPRRVAGLGVVLGRPAEEKLAELAALSGCADCADRRNGFVLSGLESLAWQHLDRRSAWAVVSVLWTNYGRQSRVLGANLSGAQATAHTMWRAGLLLLPFGLLEIPRANLHWRTDLFLAQLYCIVAGGVIAFALWNNALRVWPASRVLLFNNLIPLSTTSWSLFLSGRTDHADVLGGDDFDCGRGVARSNQLATVARQ
jgi:drug/metabolite transporter (DMT)-like permease